MIAQPIDWFLIAWFAIAALSTAYVAWDQFRHNPEPVVMKWGSCWSRCTWDRSACCCT